MFRSKSLVVVFCLVASAMAGAAPQQKNDGEAIVKHLAGIWRAPEYKVELSGALDLRVWGPHSSRVRNVELTIEPAQALTRR